MNGGVLGSVSRRLETNAAALPNLIGKLQSFVSKHSYDGIDIDWEYPASQLDHQTFFALMNALRTAFPSPRYLLSADVPPWGGTGYDFPDVTPLVDYFNILMYGCAGPWTDDGQLNSAIFPIRITRSRTSVSREAAFRKRSIFIDQLQIPPSKLNMGTPFHGYLYQNVSTLFGPCTHCGKTVLSENYGTFIKQRINQDGWQTFYDTYALVLTCLGLTGNPATSLMTTPFRLTIEFGIRTGSAALGIPSCGRWMRIMTGNRRIFWTPCTRQRSGSEFESQPLS